MGVNRSLEPIGTEEATKHTIRKEDRSSVLLTHRSWHRNHNNLSMSSSDRNQQLATIPYFTRIVVLPKFYTLLESSFYPKRVFVLASLAFVSPLRCMQDQVRDANTCKPPPATCRVSTMQDQVRDGCHPEPPTLASHLRLHVESVL